ncbi:MAG: PQQ-dependent sugar dehydrogenase [Candidatus Eiseniibacteriota bacterium]
MASPYRRLAFILLVTGPPLGLAAPGRAFDLPDHFSDDTLCTGMDQPVGMALLPDGRMLVVEKASARIRLIVKGRFAASDPILTVPEVEGEILEQGLLGIAVDPGWPVRPYIYVHYTHAASAFIKLSRFTVQGDTGFHATGDLWIDPASRYDVLADIPDNTPFHNGGTLRFGPDGMLYDSIGDDNTPCQAQDLTVLAGKILRLDVSGLPAGGGGPPAKSLITPADNPFASHPNANARLVCHYGLRNPFRFAIDPITGDMLIGDVGEVSREEVDFVSGFGRNMQWPIYEGDVPGPTTCAGVDSTSWVDPIYAYDRDQGRAVTAGVIYRALAGASIPFPAEYDGDVFFSDTYDSWLRRMKRSGDTWALAPAPGQPNPTDWGLWWGLSVTADWLQAPDGSLYYCRISPPQIRRIWYTNPNAASLSVPAPGVPRLELRAPFPSPSRAGVTFDYAVTVEGPASLTIHDVAGRSVRTLVDRERETVGSHRVTWDGRDASGRRARPGVYRARLDASGRVLERRLALID